MLCSAIESCFITPSPPPQPSHKVTPLCLSSFLRSKTASCLPSPVAYCWDDYRRCVPKGVLTKHTYSLPDTRSCRSLALDLFRRRIKFTLPFLLLTNVD